MKNFLSVLMIPAFLLISVFAVAQEYGIASYYSDDFQGRKTAYGDIYDKNKMTAAHKKHPYGTKLRVTRLDNKKSVEVLVNDKGPYIKGRVVDLSRAAADELGLPKDGLTEVKIEVVGKSSVTAKRQTTTPRSIPRAAEQPSRVIATNTDDDDDDGEETEKRVPKRRDADSGEKSKAKEDKMEAAKVNKARLVGKDYKQYGLYRIVLERPSSKGYAVQVASLNNYENVLRQVADLQSKWFENILISVERGDGDESTYKVLLGPFDKEDKATNYKSSLAKKHKIKGFVVDLNEISY
ncbi:MAG: septal ring lytic transglycosylase RlpA family protein [Bacteroidota bacterium]